MDFENINIVLNLSGQNFEVETLPQIFQGNTGVNNIVLKADFDGAEGTDSGSTYVPKISYYDGYGELIKGGIPLTWQNFVDGTNTYKGRIPKAVTDTEGAVRAKFSLFIPVVVAEYDEEDLVALDGTAYVSGAGYIVSNMHEFEFLITPCGGGGGVRPSF